jgi:uncharacterized protein (TIGR03435 family)
MVRTGAVWIVVATLGVSAVVARQSKPSFDVASVKAQPQASLDSGLLAVLAQSPFMTYRAGRFRAENVTPTWLLMHAYRPTYRHRDQFVGLTGWLDRERFVIEATVSGVDSAGNGAVIPETVLNMLQSLLESRFQLRVKQERRERPVYALVRSRKDGRLGDGLRASKDDCTTTVDLRPGDPGFRRDCIGQLRVDGIKLVARPIDELVQFLTSRVNRLVIDETGLTGTFDVDLAYEVPKMAGINSAAAVAEFSAGVFTAVQEDLGLKLESTVRPIPVLVIEHIERPTAN